MIEWRKEYRLGIPEIDAEHLVLFGLLNQIEINANAEKEQDCIVDILNALLAYAKFHFGHEEAFMAAVAYHDLPVHRASHVQFIESVLAMKDQGGSDVITAKKLGSFIYQWLIEEIFGSDARFALALRNAQKESAAKPAAA